MMAVEIFLDVYANRTKTVGVCMNLLIKESIGKKHINKIKTLLNDSVRTLKPINIKKENRSTKGNNSVQYQLDVEDNKKIINIISKHTKKFLENFNYKNFTLKPISMWSVYGQEDSYHTFHAHNNNNLPHVATVTYLDISKDNEQKGGQFYGLLDNKYFEIKPEVGTFIILGINIFHGTYPQGKGLRRTINLDFEMIERLVL
tara:strand:+ start:99 stop:704 length:606 start_codon:yes stop_codon:yes gene_type:complete